MSPEICCSERYSHHSDVWSLGCIIYELAARQVPFDARNQMELVLKIKEGKIKQLPADRYTDGLREVVGWCLKVDPTKRPDTAQLLNVPQIRQARARLEQMCSLERAQQERDAAVSKLNIALSQIRDLQQEVERLREAGKKVEMEWHAKATLAIDQRVTDAEKKQEAELRQHKMHFEAHMRQQFAAAVEQQVDEKLKLHQASLPHSHGLGENPDIAVHVRSSTPPPGKSQGSFATTATTGVDSDGSSVPREQGDSTLETDISSLSIMEQEEAEDASPLAQRTKPPPKAVRPRQPFGRAKTLAANYSFDNRAIDSPMDVHMADPSPMVNHVAPMSIKGLSLSPRRNNNGHDRLSGAGLRKNIFALAAEQKLRPTIAGDAESSFADDDLLDNDDDNGLEPDSPSRPSSGASNHNANNGDPFKALGTAPTAAATAIAAPPKRMPRPSLQRQQTMPVNLPAHHTRQRSNVNIFNPNPRPAARPTSPEKEKENRPPSSTGIGGGGGGGACRSNVPIAASPKRGPATARDGRILTPSRKAPPPPPTSNFHNHGNANANGLPRAATAGNLAKLAYANNNLQSPSKSGIKGRTLVELQQARLGPAAASSGDEMDVMGMGAKLLASPAKWDPVEMGEEMPSPFLARKGRATR